MQKEGRRKGIKMRIKGWKLTQQYKLKNGDDVREYETKKLTKNFKEWKMEHWKILLIEQFTNTRKHRLALKKKGKLAGMSVPPSNWGVSISGSKIKSDRKWFNSRSSANAFAYKWMQEHAYKGEKNAV